MNKESKNKYVVVLGSGESINSLSQNEILFLNSCEIKIALNKYTAFYKKAKIIPSHIYFVDSHSLSSILFLKLVLKTLKINKLTNITLITSRNFQGYLISKKLIYLLKYIFRLFKLNIKTYFKNILNILFKIFPKKNKKLFRYIENSEKAELFNFYKLNYISNNLIIQYIELQNWISFGNSWSNSMNEPLYHFRSSLTTVLNYISINFKNSDIIFVGVDLDNPKYFFYDQLPSIDFNFNDWTSEITKQEGKHFTIVSHENTKMQDEFPFIIEQLRLTGNKIYSMNHDSFLVKEKFIEPFNLNVYN